MKAKTIKYTTLFLGLLLLTTGFYLIKTAGASQGVLAALPYVSIGIGSGLFGHGLGNVISEWAIRNAPDLQKKRDIEKNDERNITIENKAKGKAFDMMTYIFGALMVSFALIDLPIIALLLFVFAYLFVHGFAIYYRMKFNKEM